MNLRRLWNRIPGPLTLAVAGALLGGIPAHAQTKPAFGKLAGVVRDSGGTPQMGASVQIIREGIAAAQGQELLTNTQGIFRGEKVAPGLYTIRVTLAGFLPTLEQHVRITANLTTLVRIELESMFASLDRLRRQPASSTDQDEWKWVLRSAASMRPVLQWAGEDSEAGTRNAAENASARLHARLELTSGARRPGSVSNLADAAGTAFAYDLKLSGMSRLLLAGQMSYERAAAGSIAAVWLPAGSFENGPRTTLVLRQAKLGPDGLTFRGARLEQNGAVSLGDRAIVRYGAEFIMVGLGRPASALRPRAELEVRLNDDWRGAVVFAAQPGTPAVADAPVPNDSDALLIAALNELDAFPTLLWRAGRPVLEGGWHEEISARRKLGSRGSLHIAAFHDDNHHVAVFARGDAPANADYFRDFFSNGIVYDGGASSSWGARAGLREKLNENVELTTVYTFAGALVPGDALPGEQLRDALRTGQRHALSAGLRAKAPRLGTQLSAGYQWINGLIVSRLDSYGESLFQTDPYLHVSVRQPLPKFAPGRWEALAECQNLFKQGYVSVNSGGDGRMALVPAFRSFRGGLSVQF